jgi:hypothetical protein
VNQALCIHLRACSINPLIGIGLTEQSFSTMGITEVKIAYLEYIQEPVCYVTHLTVALHLLHAG